MKIAKSLLPMLLAATTALCQQTDFSGTWILVSKQHVSGPEYDNALARQIKVEQSKDSLILEITSLGPVGNDIRRRASYPMNRQHFVYSGQPANRKFDRSLNWSADKKIIMMTTIFYRPENYEEIDFTRIEEWSISDGKLNVQKRSIETRSDNWEVRGFFEKQD